MDKLSIKYIPLEDIKLLDKNFKGHALAEVEASLNRFGFVDPVGINPITGNAYDGNGRTKTLTDMRRRWLQGEAVVAPKGIVVNKNNQWLVPTVEREMTELEEVALAGALNRINELGGYEDEKMLEILEYLRENDALEGTGFNDDDLALLLEQIAPEPPTLDDLKDQHGDDGGMNDFTAGFTLKLSLSMHKRFDEFWNGMSGAPDEKVEFILRKCE